MMYRKDVTNEEIERAMQPVLDELSRFLVPRVKLEDDKKIHFKEKTKEEIHISEEEREYLKSILEHPNLSVTARGEKLFGFSADKRTRIKKNLLDKKLILEFSVDLGSDFGGRVKLLRLTEQGHKLLGEKPPLITNFSKRGSLEHIWWQEFIAQDYLARGYKAIIEKELNGKAADIGIMAEDETVAVEVELSPKNAITNFKQNIDAGFTRAIIACKNYQVKKQVQSKVNSFIAENPIYKGKEKIILLTDFPFIKHLSNEIRG